MHSGDIDLTGLRRAAISASCLKAIPSLALGGYSVWSLTTPMDALVGLLALYIAAFSLYGAVGYMLAAFLLSRRPFVWRLCGGIIDATATAAVAWVIFWLSGSPGGIAHSGRYETPRAVPPSALAGLAVVWIAASAPMRVLLLLDAPAAFRRRRHHT